MKKIPFLLLILICGTLSSQDVFARSLDDDYQAGQPSAIAGALTAQQLIRPFNPIGPIIDHYYPQYDISKAITKPTSPAALSLLKARLVWEYGPLSSKALLHVENLNDVVLTIARENPGLLKRPADLPAEIDRKLGNLLGREKTFHGLQAEASEARHRGWQLMKNPSSETFDLYDPNTRISYQMKIFKTASASLRRLQGDYADFVVKHPEKAHYFKGMMAEDQIHELITDGKLIKSPTPAKVGTQSGIIEEQSLYVDRDTGIKIIAAKSEATAKQFQANVRKGYSIYKQLQQRLGGFGPALAGGFIVGAGVSTLYQVWQGEGVHWASVAESGGIGLASSAATVYLAQQIEQRFGQQLAKCVIAKLLPGLARGTLAGGAAANAVGAFVVLGFVAKDYFTDQITTNEALIQSGIGLGSVGVGVSASMIATWATAGTLAGSEVPVLGNLAGFLVGVVGGTAVYLGGNWYYENFQVEYIRAEMEAFKREESMWNTRKIENEMSELTKSAQTLRAEATAMFR